MRKNKLFKDSGLILRTQNAKKLNGHKSQSYKSQIYLKTPNNFILQIVRLNFNILFKEFYYINVQ